MKASDITNDELHRLVDTCWISWIHIAALAQAELDRRAKPMTVPDTLGALDVLTRKPNAEAEARRSRTVQPLVGSLDGDK